MTDLDDLLDHPPRDDRPVDLVAPVMRRIRAEPPRDLAAGRALGLLVTLGTLLVGVAVLALPDAAPPLDPGGLLPSWTAVMPATPGTIDLWTALAVAIGGALALVGALPRRSSP